MLNKILPILFVKLNLITLSLITSIINVQHQTELMGLQIMLFSVFTGACSSVDGSGTVLQGGRLGV
jgi:hypothetical protein